MRIVIQRVKEASVTVDQKIVGKIGPGALILFGVHKNDTASSIPYLTEKLIHLRMFTDDAGKMNLSLQDIKGSLLIVSQFTLYADCGQGRRPSFIDAAPPGLAEEFYNSFIQQVKQHISHVQTGVFGAYMQVQLINDGPVTFIIDKN